jgi:hypothetical protein
MLTCSSFSGINNTPFGPHQQETTYDEYRVPILGLLGFLLRAKTNYTIASNDRLEKYLPLLREALESQDAEKIARRIFNVLLALWTYKWPSTIGKNLQDPTICYLALSMMQQDGTFKEPKYTTVEIARFEYFLRMVIDLKMMSKTITDPEIDWETLEKEYSRWYTEKVDSTFNSLRSLTHRASAIAYSSMSLPRIWWTDRKNYRSMLYKGDLVDISPIQKCFDGMEAEAVALWENEVMCGTGLRVEYKELADDLSNSSAGYSFLTDERNTTLQGHETSLVKAILANSALREQFTVGQNMETGMLEWNKQELRQWLYQYGQFELLQLSRLEMTGEGLEEQQS